MKKSKRIVTAFLSLMAVFSLIPVSEVFAVNRIGFYLTPSTQTVATGTTFGVKFMVDVSNRSPGAIGVSGKINFPKNILNVASIDTTGSNYTMYASTSFDNAAGTVTFNRSNYYPTANSVYVFTINFKAINTGTANVAFDPSSSGQRQTPRFANGGTYTVRSPTCPSGQVGTFPNCSVPAPVPKPKPTPTPTPVVAPPVNTPPEPVPVDTITPSDPGTDESTPVQTDAGDLSIRDVTSKPSWKDASLSWSATLSDSLPSVEIGTTKESLEALPEPTKQEDGTFLAQLTELEPGTRYYYLISATSRTDETKKATYSGAFTTLGYPVSLIFTQEGQPLAGAKVAIDKGTYTTDKKGRIALGLAGKKYDASITGSDGKTQGVTFTVAKKPIPSNGKELSNQEFTFNIGATASDAPVFPVGMIVISLLGAITLIGSLFGFLLYRRKKTDQLATPTPVMDTYSWESSTPSTQPTDMTAPPSTIPTTEYQPTPSSSPFAVDYTNTQDVPIEQNYSSPVGIVSAENTASTSIDDGSMAAQDQFTPQIAPSNSPAVSEVEVQGISLPPEEQQPQPPLAQEPEATYDPATGELNITHHASTSHHKGVA